MIALYLLLDLLARCKSSLSDIITGLWLSSSLLFGC